MEGGEIKKKKQSEALYSAAGNVSLTHSSLASLTNSSLAGYAASLVPSTQGSWDEYEQDYDEKSTKKVLDMMNELDGILYLEESNSSNTELVDECKLWNNLFPHIRYYISLKRFFTSPHAQVSLF